ELQVAVRDATGTWALARAHAEVAWPGPALARKLAHDLLNPLGATVGFLSLLEEELTPGPALVSALAALDGAHRTVAIIEAHRSAAPLVERAELGLPPQDPTAPGATLGIGQAALDALVAALGA